MLFVTLVTILGPILFAPSNDSEFIWNRNSIAHSYLPYLVTTALFFFNAILFCYIGEKLGEAMNKGRPLPTYCANIAGSIAGTLAFLGLSLIYTHPAHWFFACFAPVLLLLRKRNEKIFSTFFVLCSILVLTVPSMIGTNLYWSPYYQITVWPLSIGDAPEIGNENLQLFVNSDSHQELLNLDDGGGNSPYLESKRAMYDLPYKMSNPKSVLVLGAGGGNDVAAALRNGAEEVDAIEIDPVIAALGRELHPERPYENGGVNLIVDDARSFIRKTNKTYDVVIFGFLDSHRIFSSMPSVRMDSFVYTVESFNEVKKVLKENGTVAVTFTVHEKWIADRIFHILNITFKQEPVVFQSDRYGWGTVFLVKNGEMKVNETIPVSQLVVADEEKQQPGDYTWLYLSNVSGFVETSGFSDNVEVPTDDWPFLYMRDRAIPGNYLVMLFLALLSALILFKMNNAMNLARSDLHLFLLGFSFMLLETKSLTEMSLLIGSVWIVSSLVITGVLAMIFLANLFVMKFKPKRVGIYYAFLLASIALNYLFPVSNFAGASPIIKEALSTAYLTIPIFFAAIVFAIYFDKTDNSGRSLGMNTLGAVIGGIAEYSVLVYGMKTLYLIAFFAYVLSYIFYRSPWKTK